jgi:hypothetical protein
MKMRFGEVNAILAFKKMKQQAKANPQEFKMMTWLCDLRSSDETMRVWF